MGLRCGRCGEHLYNGDQARRHLNGDCKIIKIQKTEQGNYMFWCEGCQMMHIVNVDKNERPRWEFNGDFEKPTLRPSVLVEYPYSVDKEVENRRCHMFVENGFIRYLSDCTHTLAGKTVQMVNVDEVK